MSSLSPRIDRIDKNYLINGNFDFWQRTVANDLQVTINRAYGADRWMIFPSITNGTAARMQRTASTNVGSTYDVNIGAFSVANAKVAMAQIIEFSNTVPLRGKDVTVSIQGKGNGSIVRVELLSWTGTANTVTAFTNAVPYTNWTTYSLAASFTSLGSVQAAMNNTVYTKLVLNASVPANANNIIIVVSYVSGSDQVFFSQAQLVVGTIEIGRASWAASNIGEELALCQRYFEKSYSTDTVPGSVTPDGQAHYSRYNGSATTPGPYFRVEKRRIPTMTLRDPANSNTGVIRDLNANNPIAATPVNATTSAFAVDTALGMDTLTAYRYHWTADAEL
jgi:hypothetical protein